LAYIFCCKDAGLPIKTYSPETIVLPILRTTAEAEQEFQIPPGDSLTTEQYEQAKEQIVSDLKAWIKPLHALVIGPGLGRDPLVLSCAMAVITAARERDLPIVVDGDALWALNQDLDIIQGYSRCILTPNPAEYRRLYMSVAASLESSEQQQQQPQFSPATSASSLAPATSSSTISANITSTPNVQQDTTVQGDKAATTTDTTASTATSTLNVITPNPSVSASSLAQVQTQSNNTSVSSPKLPVVQGLPEDEDSIWDPKSVRTIAAALGGVTILRKGQIDVISDGRRLITCTKQGGLRRCGGQGDVLAGITGTLIGWNYGPQSGYENTERIKKREGHRFTASRTMLAAWGACNLTKEASRRAYDEHHRGVTTPHILTHIGPSFYDLCEHYIGENIGENRTTDFIQELL